MKLVRIELDLLSKRVEDKGAWTPAITFNVVEELQASSDQVPRVDLPSGPVTLEALDDLAAQLNQLDTEAKQIFQASEAPIANARLKVQQAGELLCPTKPTIYL